jgi:hypothetical protein
MVWCAQAVMQRIPNQPEGGQHVLFEHFWVEAGPLPLLDPNDSLAGGRFVMTPSVSMHLRNLARAVLCRYPILLQVIDPLPPYPLCPMSFL